MGYFRESHYFQGEEESKGLEDKHDGLCSTNYILCSLTESKIVLLHRHVGESPIFFGGGGGDMIT